MDGNKVLQRLSPKVSIIGAGNVGTSIAYALILRDLTKEIILIDKDFEKAIGEAEDIRHGIAFMGKSNIRAGEYSEIKNSDLIIITAGRNRSPGETRLDLTVDNISILKDIYNSMLPYYNKNSLIMIITNPVDILTEKMTEWLKASKGKIFGTGCLLDTSRLISVISDYLRIEIEDIDGYVAGEHGNTQFTVWGRIRILGKTIEEFCEEKHINWSEEIKKGIEGKVVSMGAEIIKVKGKTNYGIATCVCYLIDIIYNQKPTKICVSSRLSGEYGINDISLSLPSIIGRGGIEKILVDELSEQKTILLKESEKNIKIMLEKLDEFF